MSRKHTRTHTQHAANKQTKQQLASACMVMFYSLAQYTISLIVLFGQSLFYIFFIIARAPAILCLRPSACACTMQHEHNVLRKEAIGGPVWV